MEKIKFISVGRLVEEKGTHHILHMMEELAETSYADRYEVHIFGNGVLRPQVERAAEKYPNLYYHGHVPKQQVFEFRASCHYTLMPSIFLETFGLTALDSLSVGTPVVGYKKGGLDQFIPEKFAIGEKRLNVVVPNLIDHFDPQTYESDRQISLQTYEKYTVDKWLDRFQKYSGLQPGAKILMVSDYVVDMGGIENLILNMQRLLIGAGYQVELIGKDTHTYGKARRMDLFLTASNKRFARKLEKKVEERSPDLIRRHSVMRYIGVDGVALAKTFKQQQRMMHHDFGLFHPFPSLVHKESQLVDARTYKGYISEGSRQTSMAKFLVPLKWRVAEKIKAELEFIEKHFVPSSYMEDHIQRHFPSVKVQSFPHFI